MNQVNQNNKLDNTIDEISLRHLVGKLRSGAKYLTSKWLTILICAVIGGALGLAYAIVRKPVYTAICTFVLEEGNKASALSQYSGLASLAGIDIGGGGGGGIFQGDNIIELYTSRSMIQKTLLSKANISNENELLIDRYIEFNHLRQRWEKEKLGHIDFHTDPAKFSRTQDSIIADMVVLFNKSVLNVIKPDKKLTIIEVSVSGKDELFCKAFADKIVENVNNFYTQTKIKKSLQNVMVLQKQSDSVRSELNGSIGGVASAIDAAPNANPGMLRLRVPSQRRQIDVQANTAIYSELVKNLELSKMSLRQETPLIQTIDMPILPLAVDKLSKVKGIVVGFILALILTTVFLGVKKLISASLN